MGDMRKDEEKRDVDILILHGMSLHLVNYLKDLFNSMGFKSAKVVDLPSQRMTQSKKVDYYIKHCKVPLVLATHDEEGDDVTRVRPNVHNEIARCLKSRPKELIVLQEKTVDLGSNVGGTFVCIPFEIDEFYLILPNLISELKSREILYSKSIAEKRIGVGKILNEFLDEMDHLWDKEFDEAWDKIHRLNYGAESKFAVNLDKFFQQYHKVIKAVVKERISEETLRPIINSCSDESRKLASVAWDNVAEAKLKKIDDTVNTLNDSKKSLQLRQLYADASMHLRQGEWAENDKEKIDHFRKCIDLVDRYIKRHGMR